MPGHTRKADTSAPPTVPGDAVPAVPDAAPDAASDSASGGQLYHIGDAARLTGLTEHTLRAWERVGLLSPQRSPGGVRRYTADDLARLRLIARTLDTSRLSRRAVADLLASGDLRPSESDYRPAGGFEEPEDASLDGGAYEGRRVRLAPTSSDLRVRDARAHVDASMVSGLGIDEILSIVCRECCYAFSANAALLWLLETEHPAARSDAQSHAQSNVHNGSRWLVPAAGYGATAWAALRASPRPRIRVGDPRTLLTRALRTHQGIQVNTLNHFALAHPDLPHLLPAAALAALPLLDHNGEPVGVLTLRVTDSSRSLSDDDLRTAQVFANQAAMAIQTARLEDSLHAARRRAQHEEQRSVQRERCLAAVARAAVGAQGAVGQGGAEGRAARVLAAFEECAGLPVVSASLHLLDRERGVLRRVGISGSNAAGPDEPALAGPADPRQLALAGSPLYSDPSESAPAWYDDEMRATWPATGIRSWAAMPLRAGGKLYGLWTVGFGVRHTWTWDAGERVWMEACADTIALALESASRVEAEP